MERKAVRKPGSEEIAKRNAALTAAKAVLLLVQAALFAHVAAAGYRADSISDGLSVQDIGYVVIYLGLLALLAHVYGAFHVGCADAGEVVYSLSIAQAFTLFFQYLILCVGKNRILNPLPLAALLLAGVLINAVWTKLAVRLYRRLFPPKQTCVIYDYTGAREEIGVLKTLQKRFDIRQVIHISDGIDSIMPKIEGAEAVFLCGLHSGDRNRLLKRCIARNIQVYIRPKIGDLLLCGCDRLHLKNMTFLHCIRNRTSMLYQIVKRAMDICMSGVSLLLLSPIMAVVALLIRSYDGGPALYRQTRLTKDGKEFEILKFRSMRVDAEKDGVARLASDKDERITPVGNVIRKVRLDELPQLINILKGDMSIVGPRPERPEIAAQYESEMPEFGLRLQVKAGLTGYAQVYGRYNSRPYDKLQMDLLYIAHQSVFQDLKLILVTVKVLFMPESTQGVNQGQVTAADAGAEVGDESLTQI